MKSLLLVAMGGALGSVARYAIGSWVTNATQNWKYPAGTFLINVMGCLMAGVAFGVSERYGLIKSDTKLFVFVGLLGGFTTFSAFGLETVTLFRRGLADVAIIYIALSILCGLAALWAGLKFVLWFPR